MDDSELRNDETILLTTQGIYVKSIPFEGVITNKRILLVDRAKNLLPPKEILLATIRDIEAGENAIRDQIITLSIIAKTGETRQMILTFSRQAGGTRIKERNEWVKILKERTRSSFEQVIRKVIPGLEPESARYEETPAPRIEVINSPVQPATPGRIPIRKEIESAHPVKKIIETGRVTESIPITTREPEPEEPLFGTFCSRCGNEVATDAVFCNRCGYRIVAQSGTVVKPAVPSPEPVTRTVVRPSAPVTAEPPAEEIVASSMEEAPSIHIPSDPIRQALEEAQADEFEFSGPASEPVGKQASGEPQPSGIPTPARAKNMPAKSFLPRIFSSKDMAPTPLNPRSMPTAPDIPTKPGRSQPGKPEKPGKERSFQPTKKTVMAVGGIVLLVALLAIFFFVVYPMLTAAMAGSGSNVTGQTPVATPTSSAPGTPVVTRVPTSLTVPATGVFVHIDYIGNWDLTYGLPSVLQSARDSGEKFYEVLNATGTVQAAAFKNDTSTRPHVLLVEIYKDGKLLTTGSTSDVHGSVALSVDVTTGIAQPAKTGTGAAIATGTVNGTATTAGTTTPVKTTAKPTATVVKTTTAAK